LQGFAKLFPNFAPIGFLEKDSYINHLRDGWFSPPNFFQAFSKDFLGAGREKSMGCARTIWNRGFF